MTDLREQLQQDLGNAYTLEHELGGGGMSRVFVATDNALGRKVVIKILPPEMAAAVSSQRFRREIQLAANLQHPHIVPLLSAGETNGLPYFTMPYVKGESLRAHLAKVGELPLSEAIRTLRETASALAYAHENHVVHRDIKPENVLISAGSAVVTDFGVAKALSASADTDSGGITSTGMAIGTPAYMAPEQATADPHTDHRADIYALGVMAYEMITGNTPFAGRSPQATLAAHVTEEAEPITRRRSNTPPGLAAIVMRCLEKRPADRYQTANAVVHDLDALSTPSGGMTPTASYRVANRRTWIIPALAAIVLLVAAAGVYGIASRNDAAVALPSEQQSIAVLPFKNLSGDPANDYFGDGLTEELQGVLSQIGGLRVVARGSSFQFKGKDADPRDVGAKLGVANILDGGVQKSGDRIRITAQLIDTKTGYQIWNETYNRTLSDALAVQDEITSAIGQALRIQFDPASQHFKSRKAVNPAAYDMYLKGLSATRRPSTDALNEGLGYYKQAVQLDSGFTPAWTSMAITYINLANFRALPASKVLPQAEEAMNRALKQDPENPYVQGAYAVLLEFEEKYDQAELQYRKVIEKNPNNSAAHANYSGLLTRRGKLEEAIREAEMAQRLDPLSLSKFSMLGIALMSAGRSKDALAVFDKAETMSPNAINIKVNKSLVLADMGQGPEALKECDRAASLAPDDPQVRLNCAYVKAKAGQRGDALKVVQEFESLPDADNFAVDIAGIYSALGDKDKAFDWLDRIRSIQGFYPATEPTLAGLHNDPRFAAWLNRWKGK